VFATASAAAPTTPAEGARELFGYDKTRGGALADAFAAGVPEDEFFRLLEAASFQWLELDGLVAFCPCNLRNRETERLALCDLFLAKSDLYDVPESLNRRDSLALILDLTGRCCSLDGYSLEDVFRASAYSNALADGAPWGISPGLRRIQRGWSVYQQNELFSVALQALFAAVLRSIESSRSGRIQRVADAGDVCVELLPSSGGFRERRLADAILDLRTVLPPLSAWQEDMHEMQRWRRILSTGEKDTDLTRLVDEGIHILMSLLARGVEESPYSEFEFEPDYCDPKQVHLLSFKQAWQSTWADMTIEEWARWLAVHWGLEQHLRVALRKLRGERRDTFRIRPLERDLVVIEAPSPVATQPRLGKAFQILRDLDLLDFDSRGWLTVTSNGRKELEAYLAR
jgi:hypothetical protein